MKIILLQDYLRSGGTERQTLLLARLFRRQGHDAHVLTFRPGGKLAEGHEDLVLPALQAFDLGLDWFAPGLLPRLASLEPDVVMTMGRMANSYGWLIQRRFPALPVIGTYRTGKALPVFYRKSLREVRAVVANSTEAAQRLSQEYGLAPQRVKVVHNSLVFEQDTTRPPIPEGARLREAQGAGLDTVVALNVAMFRREKNQQDLIRAAALLPPKADWQLWLVGDGDQRETCERLADRLELRDRVRFFGFQSSPLPFYQAADLAVHASSRESLSNFLIEAQAHGLPGVVFEAQGMRECIVPGETGEIVPFGDLASLARSWGRLLEDKPLRERWGVQARTRAREAFSPERQARLYLELFQHWAGSGSGP